MMDMEFWDAANIFIEFELGIFVMAVGVISGNWLYVVLGNVFIGIGGILIKLEQIKSYKHQSRR